jgi:N-acetylmuramoyl-L-alanine amidase
LLIPAGALPTDDPLLPELAWTQARRDAVQLTIRLGREMPYTLDPSQEANRLALVFPPQVRDAGLVFDSGRRLLTIRSTAPMHPVVKRLADPDRLVIDLPGAALAGPSRLPVGDPWVEGLRLGQLDVHTVRLVADLEGPLGWMEVPPAASVSPMGGVAAPTKPASAGALAAAGAGTGDGTPAPGLFTWTIHLYNRVTDVSFKTLKDRTQLSFELAVAATPTVLVDRRTGRLEVDLPEAMGDGLAGELPVQDGTVDRLRLVDDGPGTVRWAVDLPYYVGHQVLPSKGAEAVVEVSRSPVYRQRIYLDPGHGGADPGALSPGGLMEKEVNLDIALRLRQLLTEAGAVVTLSRETDVFIPLYDRPRQANSQEVAAFVSVHSNANPKPTESGTETYFHPDHPGSRELAEEVQTQLNGALRLLDRGIRANREFVVIREITMPGILVEVAFLSNPAEEKLLGDPAFRQKAAGAIADGIIEFFRGHGGRWPKPASVPTPAPAPAA